MRKLAQQLGKVDGGGFFAGNNHIVVPWLGICRQDFAYAVAQAAFDFITRYRVAAMLTYRVPYSDGAGIVGDALHAKSIGMLLAATLGAQKICPF